MTSWKDLISELDRLDKIAQDIQVLQYGRPIDKLKKEELETFIENYMEWYSTCSTILEDKLKEYFQNTYKKDVIDFLTYPTKYYDISWVEGDPIFKFSYPYSDYFHKAVVEHRTILLEASKTQKNPFMMNPLKSPVDIIKDICENFHIFAHQLTQRYSGHIPFPKIEDEYDVQDIIHALLKLFFQDVRAEEDSPSHAGKNTRIDFFLPRERIIVETKKTRKDLTTKKLGEDLTVDIIYYKKRGYDTFIGFVYDPDKYVKNPSGFEHDISQTSDNKNIIIIVNQG